MSLAGLVRPRPRVLPTDSLDDAQREDRVFEHSSSLPRALRTRHQKRLSLSLQAAEICWALTAQAKFVSLGLSAAVRALLQVDVESALEQPRSFHQLTCSKPTLGEQPLLADQSSHVGDRTLSRTASLSFERVVLLLALSEASESRTANVTDGGDELDEAPWQDAADRIRFG